jgi:hypothetical protein
MVRVSKKKKKKKKKRIARPLGTGEDDNNTFPLILPNSLTGAESMFKITQLQGARILLICRGVSSPELSNTI